MRSANEFNAKVTIIVLNVYHDLPTYFQSYKYKQCRYSKELFLQSRCRILCTLTMKALTPIRSIGTTTLTNMRKETRTIVKFFSTIGVLGISV